MKKQKEPKDRHLDVPAEANRDKHINFVAEEQGEQDPADEPQSDNLEKRNKEFEQKKRRKND